MQEKTTLSMIGLATACHTPIVMRIIAREAPLDAPEEPPEDGGLKISIPEGTRSLTLNFE